jgi:hypothetical protein
VPPLQPPLAELREATGQIEQAVVETIVAATAGAQRHLQSERREASVDNLDQAAQRFNEAVQDVETLVVAAQEESKGAHATEEVRHVRKEIEEGIRRKRD